LIVMAALGGIAWALSDSVLVGSRFALMLSLTLLVLLALAAVTLWLLRMMLHRVRLHLPSSLRHGLANLYRPGNQSAAVMAALGTGVMLILAVYLMQASLLRDLGDSASIKLPNLFLCGGPVCSDRFFGFLSGIIVRRNRGGGNVKISFIDFQGLWEGRETVLSFSVLSTDRHFHGRLRCALCRPC